VAAELDWDFGKSADLVGRFVDMRALSGAAWVEGGSPVGYVYYVFEENKGLIGDLYLMRRWRTPEREDALLTHALDAIMTTPDVKRIESQLMMLRPDPRRRMPGSRWLKPFERNFMRIELGGADLRERDIRRPVYIENFSDGYLDGAAQLIAAAYAGHVDSSINDQYRTPAGARRFLHNIVQYPGCGSFLRPASFAALDPMTGRLVGVCLTSEVSPDSGHITQICLSSACRGVGIGRELLRRSLRTLREFGLRSATLTVTASNSAAVALYEQVGFRTIRKFSAYVWENLRGWTSAE
jgi:ribosomal protein S18 acetylase RimI-like enzyme